MQGVPHCGQARKELVGIDLSAVPLSSVWLPFSSIPLPITSLISTQIQRAGCFFEPSLASFTRTLFPNNQSAAQSPFDPAPTRGQTLRFALRSLALWLERECPKARLAIQSLAGHHGIAIYEAVDEVARRATGEVSDALADVAVLSGGKRQLQSQRGILQGFKLKQSEHEPLAGDKREWDKGGEKRARDFERRLERRQTDDLAMGGSLDRLVPGGHELLKSLSSGRSASSRCLTTTQDRDQKSSNVVYCLVVIHQIRYNDLCYRDQRDSPGCSLSDTTRRTTRLCATGKQKASSEKISFCTASPFVL